MTHCGTEGPLQGISTSPLPSIQCLFDHRSTLLLTYAHVHELTVVFARLRLLTHRPQPQKAGLFKST
jgi:hypothetical protein